MVVPYFSCNSDVVSGGGGYSCYLLCHLVSIENTISFEHLSLCSRH